VSIIKTHNPLKQFNDLYQQYYTSVFCVVSRFMSDRHETEDIVQEVFVKLYLQLKAGSIVLYPKTWLYKVATNMCLNLVTRRREIQSIEQTNISEVSPADSLEKYVENKEQKNGVEAALLKLKENERLIVILYSEGLSYKEISEISGVKFTSIGQSIYRALQKLKPLLKTQYDEMLNQ